MEASLLEHRRVSVGDVSYHLMLGGSGPPVLLLHGFPQTHYCWRKVAPQLAGTHTVVAPDLRGYGNTVAPPGGPRGEGYSKREMAGELVALMKILGFDRFAVVGHDRGARVAYRMALDHPAPVERLVVLNVVPPVDERRAGPCTRLRPLSPGRSPRRSRGVTHGFSEGRRSVSAGPSARGVRHPFAALRDRARARGSGTPRR